MLHNLSNDFLIDSYKKANLLDLDHYFIFLIEQELSKRGLSTIQTQYAKAVTEGTDKKCDGGKRHILLNSTIKKNKLYLK